MRMGDRIRTLRKEMGLTQQEFADRVGIHIIQITRYETGKSVPSVNVLDKIAKFCEVTVDYIIHGTDKEMAKRTRVNDTELLDLFRRINNLKKGNRDRLKWAIAGLLNNE